MLHRKAIFMKCLQWSPTVSLILFRGYVDFWDRLVTRDSIPLYESPVALNRKLANTGKGRVSLAPTDFLQRMTNLGWQGQICRSVTPLLHPGAEGHPD